MSKIQMEIWGRQFNIDIYYKKFQGKEITGNQKETYAKFIAVNDVIEKSKSEVIAYIENKYSEYLPEEKIENIFKYVIPKTLYVPKENKKRVVILLCDFKFDIEHGLAVVYENERFKEIVSQDEVL